MTPKSVLLCTVVLASCGNSRWNPEGGTPLPPQPANNPFIHQDGTRLVDGNGAQVSLIGMNLGGWLLWEAWIWGGGWQSEKDMLVRFTQLLGEDGARAFQERVRDRFIQEEDIAEIARLGFNSVRIPFNHTLLEEDSAPFEYRPEGWAVLDRVLDWCERHGIVAVLDLHSAPGGQSWFYMEDPDGDSLWDSEEHQERTVALWKAIAERYADHPAVAGYDLLNEPRPPSGEALVDIYRRIAAAIREVDLRHLVIVEGSSSAGDFSMFTSPITSNQAYSFHMYTWFGDPRREEIAKYRAVSQEHDIPMWNGEFGEESLELETSTAAMYTAPDSGLSGFSFWTWKKVPNGAPCPLGVTADIPNWHKVMSWFRHGFDKPTHEETLRGIEEFFEAIKLANGTLDRDLLVGLGATP